MKNLTLFNHLDRRPGRVFSDFDRDFERLFDLYSPSRIENDSRVGLERSFAPSFDLLDKESHYVMSFDIPGVKQEDVNIEVSDGILSVEGERKFEHREGDYVERKTGQFKRMVQLPEGVEEDNVEAHFENGVLSVALPKAQKTQPKKVTIKQGDKSGVWSRLLGSSPKEKTSD